MKVAQNSGQAAHVVGVRVAEGHHVEVANAARPENLGDDLLADVVVLGRLMRTAAEAAAIHQQVLPSGVMSSRESPCPTSMASTSRALRGWSTGRGETAATAASSSAAHAARRGQRAPEETASRASTMAAASRAQKASEWLSSGAGMRKSP